MNTRTILIASTLLLAPSAAYAQTIKPSFSIDNVSCQESSGACTFRVRKHGRLNALSSSVRFYTMPGTARSATDYIHQSVVLTFSSAELVKYVTVVLVKTPATVERAETMTGKLAVLTNARCYDCTATGTILESAVATVPDPTPPSPTTKVCPDGSVIPIAQNCPVVTPPPVINPPPDPTPPPVTPTTPSVSVDARNCPEGTNPCTVWVWRSGDLTLPSTYNWATNSTGTATPGVDFVVANGSVTIQAGVQATSFPLTTIDDALDDDNETIGVQLAAVTNLQIGGVEKMPIIDNDDPPIVPPEPPPTQVCPDGSVIPAADTCPPPPVVPGGDIPSPSLTGLTPIASNFNVDTAIINNYGGIPGSGVPDVVGAFRFICGAGQILYDDPILYPGQPGKSHLHQFYGNVGATGNSTYSGLRISGDSTCNWTGAGVAANRSAYWMPAMLDGKGNVVRPDYISVYYKMRPPNDPIVSDPSHPQYQGKGIPLPNGLRFIFGWDPTGLNQIRTGGMWFNCSGPTAVPGNYSTLTTARANCPRGQGNQIGAVINAPDCWDGKRLDSADHRSHVAYAGYTTGYLKCPNTHPYVIPTFTQGAWYSVEAGDDGVWELASDHMAPGQPKGYTFHADFFMAWDPGIHNVWFSRCISLLLNCSGGQLGDGRGLRGAATPTYNGVQQWKHPNRLVPVPVQP